MKRVEACEENPWEATQTNIIGTAVVARACLEAGVQRAVCLSTDKAVGPNTLYGVTKLAAERLWVRFNVYGAGTHTKFSATRYGNVLGSRGSVLPLFRAQAQAGGPITLTDKRMTRFFMQMSEACELVALAFREMRGGEVFVPKIQGTNMAVFAAAVAPGIEQIEVGIRPGEKLHELLLSQDEARETYDYGDHLRIETTRTWEDGLHADVQAHKVPNGFTYTSDVGHMTIERLREMVA
jgi:UDP-N-acetylglucosamine 4,6-dehydratase